MLTSTSSTVEPAVMPDNRIHPSNSSRSKFSGYLKRGQGRQIEPDTALGPDKVVDLVTVHLVGHGVLPPEKVAAALHGLRVALANVNHEHAVYGYGALPVVSQFDLVPRRHRGLTLPIPSSHMRRATILRAISFHC